MLVSVPNGTPYTDADLEAAPAALDGKTELDALIAYLQALGRFASDAATEEHVGH